MISDHFRNVVEHLTQGMINEHEILTLARQYQKKRKPPLYSLLALIQDDLKKKGFTDFR